MSTRKAQHPWGTKWAGAKPSPPPLLPIPVGRRSALRLGIAKGHLVSAVAASYTANAPGGWVGCIGVVDELVVDGVGEEVRRAGGDRPRAAKRLQGRIADAASRSAASEILQGVFLPALTHQSVDVTPPALTVVSLRP